MTTDCFTTQMKIDLKSPTRNITGIWKTNKQMFFCVQIIQSNFGSHPNTLSALLPFQWCHFSSDVILLYCLSKESKVCDGHVDCLDHSDELCDDSCAAQAPSGKFTFKVKSFDFLLSVFQIMTVKKKNVCISTEVR